MAEDREHDFWNLLDNLKTIDVVLSRLGIRTSAYAGDYTKAFKVESLVTGLLANIQSLIEAAKAVQDVSRPITENILTASLKLDSRMSQYKKDLEDCMDGSEDDIGIRHPRTIYNRIIPHVIDIAQEYQTIFYDLRFRVEAESQMQTEEEKPAETRAKKDAIDTMLAEAKKALTDFRNIFLKAAQARSEDEICLSMVSALQIPREKRKELQDVSGDLTIWWKGQDCLCSFTSSDGKFTEWTLRINRFPKDYETILNQTWNYVNGDCCLRGGKGQWHIVNGQDGGLESWAEHTQKKLIPLRKDYPDLVGKALQVIRNGEPKWTPCTVHWTYLKSLDAVIKNFETPELKLIEVKQEYNQTPPPKTPPRDEKPAGTGQDTEGVCDDERFPGSDASLIYQSDAAEFYNIPKSTLSKSGKKQPGEPGYLWSGKKGSRVFYRKSDLVKLARSRQKLKRG
jgi:hypothetical protein